MIPIEMETQPLVADYLTCFPPDVSELTFTNLFAWRRSRPVWLVQYDGVLVFVCQPHTGAAGRYILGPPAGGSPDPYDLRSAIPNLQGYIRITGETAAPLAEAGLLVAPDDDNSDYVYRTADLADLSGERYHGKRNLIKQCLEANRCQAVELMPRWIPDCIATLDQWCVARQDDLTPDLSAEYRAIREMFDHYDRLPLTGRVVLVNGCVQAYAVGEALSPNTAVCHFEKAAPGVKGLGQLINQAFAASLLGRFEYINREQDLGVPGLRQAKESYHPHHRVRKFTAMFADIGKPPAGAEG